MKTYIQPTISVNYYYLETSILGGASNHIVESDQGIVANGKGNSLLYAL